MEILLLTLIALVLLPNLFVAGMHDVPNSIAIPTRTRALTPRIATRLAAGANALGVLMTIPLGVHLFSWFEFPQMDPQMILGVVLSALVSLLGWNLYTYFRGMPTSTTHALLAALIGGALASMMLDGTDSTAVLHLPWAAPLATLLLSPLVAFGLAYLLVFLAVRVARGADPDTVNETSRTVQAVCAGLTSLGTGLQQGQRFSFVLLLSLPAAGVSDAASWMPAAYVVFALLIGLGCLTGGWRIGHMLGHRLVTMDPMRGMVSTTTTSALLFAGSLAMALPLSTSLTAASSVIGAGSNQRFATVNWPQAVRLFAYWAVTPLVVGGASAVLVLAISPLLEF
ncbi:inorganic phosphate transporter [Nesterenkonia xinjiangensis]|uniref:PiT family inorganic phosphate transporter n=1 Tax=Nesterenkonia xinjiangensis TaxID=225327 RepID=A0A7Z0GLK6_9MICC|nr:PiT family inorganic phosphate transporter [Nesterenkonia xinjiangensis]